MVYNQPHKYFYRPGLPGREKIEKKSTATFPFADKHLHTAKKRNKSTFIGQPISPPHSALSATLFCKYEAAKSLTTAELHQIRGISPVLRSNFRKTLGTGQYDNCQNKRGVFCGQLPANQVCYQTINKQSDGAVTAGGTLNFSHGL